MVVAIFTAEREVALHDGIAEDELRGPEVVAAHGVALDGAVDRASACLGGHFAGAARRLGVVEETIDVEVDAQLACLAIVVGIEDVLRELVVLIDVALGTLLEDVVLVAVGIEQAAVSAAGMTVVFVEGTETVVLIHHVVDQQLR